MRNLYTKSLMAVLASSSLFMNTAFAGRTFSADPAPAPVVVAPVDPTPAPVPVAVAPIVSSYAAAPVNAPAIMYAPQGQNQQWQPQRIKKDKKFEEERRKQRREDRLKNNPQAREDRARFEAQKAINQTMAIAQQTQQMAMAQANIDQINTAQQAIRKDKKLNRNSNIVMGVGGALTATGIGAVVGAPLLAAGGIMKAVAKHREKKELKNIYNNQIRNDNSAQAQAARQAIQKDKALNKKSNIVMGVGGGLTATGIGAVVGAPLLLAGGIMKAVAKHKEKKEQKKYVQQKKANEQQKVAQKAVQKIAKILPGFKKNK